MVKLTSGSTGAPKGLEATAEQMVADGRQICATMGIRPGDSNLATIPFGYSYGLGNLVMPLLLQGTRIVLASSTLPHGIAADAARHRPTILATVPPLLRALAASELPGGALGSLRLVISAGSPLPPEVAQAFLARFGIRVHGFYGTSETGGIAYDRSGEPTLAGRGVGTPLEGVRLRFGKRGVFTISSPAVLGSGRSTPGDRALLNAHGELVLLGRADRTVKVAGRRLDLAEVERAIRSLAGVRDAFACPLPGAETRLAAAVETDLAPKELLGMLRASLAPWKVPSRIRSLAEFPVTSRGKADRRALRQFLAAPRTATSTSTLSAARQMSARR
jgi:acyl-coenzyme A synthetase/AMP-(fatty) acid ligase